MTDKEFKVYLHTSGKRYSKGLQQQFEIVTKALNAGANKIVVEMVDYEEITRLKKEKEDMLETFQSISFMKEGFPEDNYRAIEMADKMLEKYKVVK